MYWEYIIQFFIELSSIVMPQNYLDLIVWVWVVQALDESHISVTRRISRI